MTMEFATMVGREVHFFAPDARYSRHSEGAFLRLQDGGILFAYSRFHGGQEDGAPSDIVSIRSDDEGETWSETRECIPAAHHGVENIMSVSLLRMQNGDLGLIYIVKQNDNTTEMTLARSRDEGESFYQYTRCSPADRPGYAVLNNDRVERLRNGRILLPIAYHRYGNAPNPYFDGRGFCAFLISDDDGVTWHESADTLSFPYTGHVANLQEPGVIELQNGTLWAYFRTDALCQYESFSLDGGEHWTSVQPSRFTSAVSPMKIARHPESGALYAVWNPIPLYNGRFFHPAGWGRTPLVCAVSQDDGKTWSEPVALENDPERGFCYPALFFTADDSLLAAYCSGGSADGICLARLSIRKCPLVQLEAGASS